MITKMSKRCCFSTPLMMMNCFCSMVDRRKAFSLISSRDHCQWSSPSWISDTPRAGFEPAQSLSSGLVEWSCAVVITITPRRHAFGSQRVIESQTLLKSVRQHFYPIFSSFRDKWSWKTSLLTRSEILKLLLTYRQPMTSILFIIGRIFCNWFKWNYLRNQQFFPKFSLCFWNIHKILNIL